MAVCACVEGMVAVWPVREPDELAVCNVAKSPVELARMQEPIRHPSGVYPQHLHLARDQRRHLLARLGARGPVAIVACSEGGLASTRALEQSRGGTQPFPARPAPDRRHTHN